MTQAHIIVSGYVQGVWYRKFVKTNAEKLGLTGWARNIPEGRVEALVQGSQESIEELIELCREGPPFAEVKDVEIDWEEGELAFKVFEIV
ncbi:MAG TPA: acylphosphatase [Candidatus Limnocylindrales bacterium]|nr:acylphosphatase [Candidatus Limnocylindrales bacterium]